MSGRIDIKYEPGNLVNSGKEVVCPSQEVIVDCEGCCMKFKTEVKLILIYEEIPEGETSIPDEKYSKSQIESIVFPRSMESIGKQAFWCSALREIKGGSGLKRIDDHAFCHCHDLTNIDLGNNLQYLGKSAFFSCNLKEVVIPGSLESIGMMAFSYNSDLQSVTFSEGLEKIGDFAFSDCNLSTITLPKSLRTIGKGVFSGNKNLTTIYGPARFKEQLEQECPGIQYIVTDEKE